MLRDTEALQRIWNSTIHWWNRRRLHPRKNERPLWDCVILTAANPKQAAGYELEVQRRKELGMIEPATRVLVVPDRAGKRIGSGGATLWALKQYVRSALGGAEAPRSFEELFSKKRILVMHSGGEGRRVPSNAGSGKLFATLPFEILPGRAASAFDALYVLLCACANQMDEGLVVCSGDVLAVIDPGDLHWKKGGCCGIGIPAPLELAAHHGVYLPDGGLRRVRRYLQKRPPKELRDLGAVIDDPEEGGEEALIDGAGILRFSSEVCEKLARLAGVREEAGALAVGDGVIEDRRRCDAQIDLYTDVAWPLAPSVTEDEYFADLSDGKAFVRVNLWENLRGVDFWLDVAWTSVFIHLGNLWEILLAFETGDGVGKDATGDAAAIFGARFLLASSVEASIEVAPSAHIQNCCIESKSGAVGGHSLLAECAISGRLNIGERCLVRGVETSRDIEVRDEIALFAVPLARTRYSPPQMVYCVHGLMDNPKDDVAGGATLFGAPIEEWLKSRSIAAADVWPDEAEPEKRTLWNARLYPVGGDDALPIVLWMQDGSRMDADGEMGRRWREATRVSFAEVFERIDYGAGFQQRESLVWRSVLQNIHEDLLARWDPRRYLESIGSAVDLMELHRHVRDWAETASEPLVKARMLTFDSNLLAWPGFARGLQAVNEKDLPSEVRNLSDDKKRAEASRGTADEALRRVAEAVSTGVSRTEPLDLSRVRNDRVVISSPARIDFGGGWTDTPPQCLERGGVILSAALCLNGEYPVGCRAEKIEDRVVRIEYEGMRGAEVLRTSRDLPLFQRLDDPFALVKAAMSAVGFCRDGVGDGAPLEERLESWGHGLRIVTRSNVPKGSGLGTSSILGAAVVACLRRLFGSDLDRDAIFRQVLYVEQLLTAGGGWQDQLGALVPGVKLARAPVSPGYVLEPEVEPLNLEARTLDELRGRLVLFYVGKRRVAFNMLREIVLGYLSGRREVVDALDAIYDIAFEMRDALAGSDFERFGALMTRTRMLYRLMCPQTTSDIIENIFAAAAPYASGGKCVGAGGGGFLIIMARSTPDAERVREILKQFSWRGLGKSYDFDIDIRGLHEGIAWPEGATQ